MANIRYRVRAQYYQALYYYGHDNVKYQVVPWTTVQDVSCISLHF